MFGCVAVIVLVTGFPLSAFAQDAVVTALNRCSDASRPAEARTRDCESVIAAKGLDGVEVAFAYLDLGLAIQAQGGDRQRELDAYTHALALVPDFWQARANRARLFLEAGDAEQAFADYVAMKNAGPDRDLPLDVARERGARV